MLISGSVQDVPDPDKPESWIFQVVNSWIGQRDPAMDNAARLAQIKAHASDFAEPFRSATLAMPADTIVTYNTMAYWVPIPWDNKGGRATLAGDAAHPMPPCKSPSRSESFF
jgi:2-polyprenyl-6-methoxyphenol hydroxylase-like FAD-dependent oxidoreductase